MSRRRRARVAAVEDAVRLHEAGDAGRDDPVVDRPAVAGQAFAGHAEAGDDGSG